MIDDSERLQRYKETCGFSENSEDAHENDKELSQRILAFLNNPKLDKYCMVDAFYYDFSTIPHEIKEKNQFWRDMYLLYGITIEGEIVKKWVQRWDLDSDCKIENGVAIKDD